MAREPINSIEAWFAEHQDGEFEQVLRATPFSVIVPLNYSGRIVFTTKPRVISAIIEGSKVPLKFGTIGRYGLPSQAEICWFYERIGPPGLLFLGDMDPVDLLIFALLRECLPPGYIAYLGLNDSVLDGLRIASKESSSIPCASSEQQALAFLDKVFPDWREVIGPKCARTLEKGHKVELEVMLSVTQPAAMVLQSAVFSDSW